MADLPVESGEGGWLTFTYINSVATLIAFLRAEMHGCFFMNCHVEP